MPRGLSINCLRDDSWELVLLPLLALVPDGGSGSSKRLSEV
jgi:hypothetical protein